MSHFIFSSNCHFFSYLFSFFLIFSLVLILLYIYFSFLIYLFLILYQMFIFSSFVCSLLLFSFFMSLLFSCHDIFSFFILSPLSFLISSSLVSTHLVSSFFSNYFLLPLFSVLVLTSLFSSCFLSSFLVMPPLLLVSSSFISFYLFIISPYLMSSHFFSFFITLHSCVCQAHLSKAVMNIWSSCVAFSLFLLIYTRFPLTHTNILLHAFSLLSFSSLLSLSFLFVCMFCVGVHCWAEKQSRRLIGWLRSEGAVSARVQRRRKSAGRREREHERAHRGQSTERQAWAVCFAMAGLEREESELTTV